MERIQFHPITSQIPLTGVTCFCGNPANPSREVYCSRTCALADTRRALTSPDTHYRTFSAVIKEIDGMDRWQRMHSSNRRDDTFSSQDPTLCNQEISVAETTQGTCTKRKRETGIFSRHSPITADAASVREATFSQFLSDIWARESNTGLFPRPSSGSSAMLPPGMRRTLIDIYPEWAVGEYFCRAYDRYHPNGTKRSTPSRRASAAHISTIDPGLAHSLRSIDTPPPSPKVEPKRTLRRKASTSRLRSLSRSVSTLFCGRPKNLGDAVSTSPLVVGRTKRQETENVDPLHHRDTAERRRTIRRSISFSGWYSQHVFDSEEDRVSYGLDIIQTTHNWIDFGEEMGGA